MASSLARLLFSKTGVALAIGTVGCTADVAFSDYMGAPLNASPCACSPNLIPMLTHCGRLSAPGNNKQHSEGGQLVKERLAETGASLVQSFRPISAIREHLLTAMRLRKTVVNPEHHVLPLNSEHGQTMDIHEYVTPLSHDFSQVLLYDSEDPLARLIGVEYIISKELYQRLPEKEKPYWSPKQHSIQSHMTEAPGLPGFAERRLLGRLEHTYSKAFLAWPRENWEGVPTGVPKLLIPAQGAEELVHARHVARQERARQAGVHDVLPPAGSF